MLRCTRAPVALRCTAAVRFAGQQATTHDHSACFERALTAEEKEVLEAQKHRSINAFVPGKAFMRHFIAAEQSTVSIYNRGMSALVTAALVGAAGVYAPLGVTAYSAWALIAYVFMANFLVLHTHKNWLLIAFLGAYLFGVFAC